MNTHELALKTYQDLQKRKIEREKKAESEADAILLKCRRIDIDNIGLGGFIKMNKEEILKLIEKYKNEIKKDEEMMEKEPESMFWCEDYNINFRMLNSLHEKLNALED